MEQRHLALFWGIQVVAQDGRAGKLQGAVLAPRSNRISHVIMRRGFRGTVTLPLNRAQQEVDGTLMLRPAARESARPAKPRRGSVSFSPRSVVRYNADATLPLRGLLLDGQDNAVAALLAGPARDPKVFSADQVKNLGAGSPVAIDHVDPSALPSYRPDAEAQRLANEALRDADPTGGDTYSAVRLEVRAGTTYLAGNVRLPIQKVEAEQAVRGAPGVISVENDIVTDWDIEVAVAEALAQAGLTRGGTVLVRSSKGHITLGGGLLSAEQIQQAVALAEAAVGIWEVASAIEVVEPPPAVEPPTQQDGAVRE